MSNDVPGVVVNDPDQVDRVHPLELEGEDINLPERVGYRPLETPDLWWTPLCLHRRVAEPCVIDHRTHGLGACLQAVLSS